MEQKIFTNCFLIKSDNKGKLLSVCLAMKKRGFGKGLWNGAGGKLNEGESVEMAMKREVEEEFGVSVLKYFKRAEIEFYLTDEDKLVNMHTYMCDEWKGKIIETEEMKPKWFLINEIPYEKMWASDLDWLPLIFADKIIKAKFSYTKEGGKILEKEIKIVEGF